LLPFFKFAGKEPSFALSRVKANLELQFKMAWRSHGTSNPTLVKAMADKGLITTDRVKKAMLGVGF
jgi:hypothetical protein